LVSRRDEAIAFSICSVGRQQNLSPEPEFFT
jgi:hypothetical protein